MTIKNLIAKFKEYCKENEETESDWIELDNLDRARLVLVTEEDDDYGDGVVVENEHGTTFSLHDLSKVEKEIFDTIL